MNNLDLTYLGGVLARKDFTHFASWVMPNIELTPFHCQYYAVLNAFAHGKIKRLIVSVPPQHGKSLGSSQLLPAFILGLNPNAKICIGSYAFSLAAKFSRRTQRLIKDQTYQSIFPDTKLKDNAASKDAANYIQTAEEFEIVGYTGGLRAAGREGSITGNTVDLMILDDLYKDAMEANSPLVRENTWEFYTSVVKTRLHNDSQELIVFTRWHEDDLIGRITRKEKVVELTDITQINDQNCWYMVNFEAIKKSPPTELDPRQRDEALWPARHGITLLSEKRALDPTQFDCMYQGSPSTKEGLLYGEFSTYSTLPDMIKKRGAYIDTADTGSDKLCAICYIIGGDDRVYVTDILYTTDPMEFTEAATAEMLERNDTRVAYVESNNGGRGFARAIQRLCKVCRIEWFYQSANKEARILTNAVTVTGHILLPYDWHIKWSDFYDELTAFKRIYRANKHDDAADAMTGVVEREVLPPKKAGATFHFSSK